MHGRVCVLMGEAEREGEGRPQWPHLVMHMCVVLAFACFCWAVDAPTEALPTFFDANNAKAVFRTFDPSSRGWISMPQYHAGTTKRAYLYLCVCVGG